MNLSLMFIRFEGHSLRSRGTREWFPSVPEDFLLQLPAQRASAMTIIGRLLMTLTAYLSPITKAPARPAGMSMSVPHCQAPNCINWCECGCSRY
jgi:hypothetical protein